MLSDLYFYHQSFPQRILWILLLMGLADIIHFIFSKPNKHLSSYIWIIPYTSWASLVVQMVNNLPANSGDLGLIPGLERSLEKEMATHSSILPGESHGQRSLAGYSPWGHKESDTTELLSTSTLHLNFCLSWWPHHYSSQPRSAFWSHMYLITAFSGILS